MPEQTPFRKLVGRHHRWRVVWLGWPDDSSAGGVADEAREGVGGNGGEASEEEERGGGMRHRPGSFRTRVGRRGPNGPGLHTAD
jgi:hypothetical protein